MTWAHDETSLGVMVGETTDPDADARGRRGMAVRSTIGLPADRPG
jgi:hypothetical protein